MGFKTKFDDVSEFFEKFSRVHSVFFLITCECGRGNGREEIPREVELHQVGESPEGRGVDLPQVAVGEVEPLQVDEAVPGKHLARKDLEVVAGQVQDLGLQVDLVRDGDLTLAPALHPTLACTEKEKKKKMEIVLFYESLAMVFFQQFLDKFKMPEMSV